MLFLNIPIACGRQGREFRGPFSAIFWVDIGFMVLNWFCIKYRILHTKRNNSGALGWIFIG